MKTICGIEFEKNNYKTVKLIDDLGEDRYKLYDNGTHLGFIFDSINNCYNDCNPTDAFPIRFVIPYNKDELLIDQIILPKDHAIGDIEQIRLYLKASLKMQAFI